MTNASSNGTPKQYGIRWNSYNTDTATLVDPDKSVYNMIKGKYAGISKITAGVS